MSILFFKNITEIELNWIIFLKAIALYSSYFYSKTITTARKLFIVIVLYDLIIIYVLYIYISRFLGLSILLFTHVGLSLILLTCLLYKGLYQIKFNICLVSNLDVKVSCLLIKLPTFSFKNVIHNCTLCKYVFTYVFIY